MKKKWHMFWFCQTVGTLMWMLPLSWVSARPPEPTIVYQVTQQQGDNWTWHLYTMDINGGSVRQLTDNPWDIRPDWSPDGTRIVFHSEGTLALINCDGTHFQRIPTWEKASPIDPDWSPDGSHVVFSAAAWVDAHDWHWDIFVLNLATGIIRNLTNHPRSDEHPSWSPDGKWIVFASNRDPNFWAAPDALTADLYIMDADGNQLRNLTQTQTHEMLPAWSPDGAQIAFIKSIDGVTSELYVMSVESKREHRLTNLNKPLMSLCWSPDSQQIAFSVHMPDHTEDIYRIDRDGKNLRQLTHMDAGRIARSPSWFGESLVVSPIGKHPATWGDIKQVDQPKAK